jgi:hypothetical protein
LSKDQFTRSQAQRAHPNKSFHQLRTAERETIILK